MGLDHYDTPVAEWAMSWGLSTIYDTAVAPQSREIAPQREAGAISSQMEPNEDPKRSLCCHASRFDGQLPHTTLDNQNHWGQPSPGAAFTIKHEFEFIYLSTFIILDDTLYVNIYSSDVHVTCTAFWGALRCPATRGDAVLRSNQRPTLVLAEYMP